ncbi:uncharacterized protein PV09_02835 [Verruconis gallopava]|uniref:K Homology domain-containing protein n=1 Tax=Verruconis gallopava TaxID=253628 RepID=A0A0D1XUF5_9PEZI|nr:uncharacterized protein PV09_02835 [Verruconis gallopava]KIW06381.1 hypothetical protein PV09_02835 [Verruconis gallopava]
MASQDVQAILAALQAAQHPTATPPTQAQPPPLPPSAIPAPAYSGIVPTPPPPQGGYPPYSALPQPAASGSIDLNSIKPVGHGNVNFQDALASVQGFASSRGVSSPSNAPSSRQDPRLAGRASSRRSRSPDSYNPYRDERRDDSRRQNGYGRSRSRSPPRGQRDTYASTRDRDYGRDDPDSEVVSIESNLVGLVIGRGGENLKRIEKESGARIQFITGPQHNGPYRECRLSGSVRNRQDAKNMIWKILDENGGHASAMKEIGQQPSRNQGQSQTRQAANQPKLREGENSMQIMVPDKTVGLIIGRGGETIRDLQEKSQCHINIVGENKSVNGMRPVNLIGSTEAAEYARKMIEEIVKSDTRSQDPPTGAGRQQDRRQPTGGVAAGTDKITEMIRVPSESVGMIIGKGGETIKQMQNDTGCKINVQQAQGQDIERPIELVGDYAAIARAKATIWDKVEQVKEKNGGGRSQSQTDQQFGSNAFAQQQPYGQQPYGQQPATAQAAPTADPYAPYGGYEAYTRLWAQYLQSGQAAAAATAAAPQQPQQ